MQFDPLNYTRMKAIIRQFISDNRQYGQYQPATVEMANKFLLLVQKQDAALDAEHHEFTGLEWKDEWVEAVCKCGLRVSVTREVSSGEIAKSAVLQHVEEMQRALMTDLSHMTDNPTEG